MTEHIHIHEWMPGDTYDDCFWACRCGKKLEGSAITRRLNATEKLSAEDAKFMAIDGNGRLLKSDVYKLMKYAAARGRRKWN